MKLENTVCNIDQGRTFKDLGITTNPQYYHNTFFNTSSTTPAVLMHMIDDNNQSYLDDDGDEKSYIKNHSWYPAFTLSELGAMIGKGTKAAELFWQHLINRVNSGNSSTICFNVSDVANFVIEMLMAGILAADQVNESLNNS